VASISLARNPSPSVLVGDSSRDSTGRIAGIQVTAFDVNGDTIRDAVPSFISIDRGLMVNATTGVMFGDSVRPIGARVVATVGPLQTIPDTVPVTVAPVRVRATPAAPRIEFAPVVSTTDTTRTGDQLTLTVTLSGTPPAGNTATDTMAVGFIVDWSVRKMPPGLKGSESVATALLMKAGKVSARDTTDRQGASSRLLQLRPVYFTDPALLITGTKSDTVIVDALIRRKPALLADTTVTFIIPVCLKSSTACSNTT
jgi:hypothetical protein